jgi:DNA topoisomerase-1
MHSRAAVDGDPVAAARAVSLTYTMDDGAGIRRLGRGKRFRYTDASGKAVRDRATLSRIRALAIPPAWTDVWICPDADGHLQATGRDAKGRKQYRYHARWHAVRDEVKYTRLVEFCRVLPAVRAAVEKDLRCACLCKRKVVATVVALMERAQLRVGNDEYARANGSYGATTLQDRHAKFRGDTLELAYKGKSGIQRRVRLTDRRLARIVRACRDLPGQRLFQYIDGDEIRGITSTDVNEYLREVSGGPFTAKDYRTWAATLGAAMMLCCLEHPEDARECKKCVNEVIEAVAEKLGHTTAVCRKSYIHPRVIDDFTSGALARRIGPQMKRRLHTAIAIDSSAIEVNALRAVEPLVARYLAPIARRRHA